MKPSTKFAAVRVLYHAGDEGLWEYEIFRRLESEYASAELATVRDELVGLSSVGWLNVPAQREQRGVLFRKYALFPSTRTFVEGQLAQGFLAEKGVQS
jgi:hypothetical protein